MGNMGYGSYKVKRILDLLIALCALVVLLPIIIIVSVLVRIKLGSPIFFTQDRPGLNGKIFKMIKFRTMLDATNKHGNQLPDDQRMTAFGNFFAFLQV